MKSIYTTCLATVIVLSSCEDNEHNTRITPLSVTDITPYSATVGGQIASEGVLAILSRGVCWSQEENPTLSHSNSADGVEAGYFTREITDLYADETYFARAYYTTARDTVYGEVVEFVTDDYLQLNPAINYGTVTDIDGNVYRTVTIGTQTWMAENLRTTRFRNGDQLSNVTDSDRWINGVNQGVAYCYYGFDSTKADIYGAYYNWFAASDPRNLAPEGWHVATEDDWQTLQEYSRYNFGDKYTYALRETTTAHWLRQLNPVATNETGFTALGAGRASAPSDPFPYKGTGYFWTGSGSADLPRAVWFYEDITLAYDQLGRGYNIRCVKD